MGIIIHTYINNIYMRRIKVITHALYLPPIIVLFELEVQIPGQGLWFP
jgi:hypothetical protein